MLRMSNDPPIHKIILDAMQKIINHLPLVILILLSLATGMTKLILLPEEVELFAHAGFSNKMTFAFGLLQVTGGLLLIFKSSRSYGAVIMLVTFVVASIVVFYKGMMGFGFFSILFIVLAGHQWWINRK